MRSSLKSTTASAAITEIFDVQSDDDIDYFAAVQQAGKSIPRKSAGTKWNVCKNK